MRKLFTLCCAWLALSPLAMSVHGAGRVGQPSPASPYTYVSHKVSTDNAAAQAAFERGLTLVFAYQRGEAEVSFREAARLDPTLAMAWWGIALALGPDINSTPEAKSTLQAAQALERARRLASVRATAVENDYIQALSARYTKNASPDFDTLAKAYRDAMQSLVAKYPDDADARALFAEAIMDQHPWRLWTTDGHPAPDTELLVRTIEEGLKRHPDHVGLLHFYIHAVEASPAPQRALAAARRLGTMPMEPAAAHLVHMPAHIYLLAGDWQSAIDANERSRQMALSFQLAKDPTIELACGHCLNFLTYAYAMQGDEAHALASATSYTQVAGDPGNELSVLLRFGRWDEVLAHKPPADKPSMDMPMDPRNADVMRGYWHYARGLALSATGHADLATAELDALRKSAATAPHEPTWDATRLDLTHNLDKIAEADDAEMLEIAEHVLAADLREKAGQIDAAAAVLRQAAALQDRMTYDEPPAWFYPVREKLGAVLLRAHRYAEAEAVLREALRRTPNDPRALFALAEALAAQGKTAEAVQQREAFRKIWSPAGGALTVAGL